MVRLFVMHTVDDYDWWREVYDDFDATRAELGVRSTAVFRALENPNELTVSHDFDSAEAAKAFVEDVRLMQAMESAGVVGTPRIWFAEEA